MITQIFRIHLLRSGAILFLGLIVSTVFAADKIDLERVKPVPADQPIPVQDFFRPLLLSQPVLNLSGTHIAALITAAEDQHQLLVYDLKTQKTENIGGIGDKDIYRFSWLNDRRLVFELAARKRFGLGMYAANVGKIDEPYPLLQNFGSHLVSVPTQSRLRPLVWNRFDFKRDRDQDIGVGVINTDIRSGKVINLGSAGTDWSAAMEVWEDNQKHIVDSYPIPKPGIVYHYMADKEGELAFAFTADEGRLAMYRLVEKQWVKCPVDMENIDVVDCGDQPGQVVVRGPRQDGKPRALQFMDAATGQLGEVLLQDKGYDFDGWLYRDPVSHVIIGAVGQRSAPFVTWFNDDYRNLQKKLNGFFPGMVVRILGSDEAQKLFLVSTSSDRQPAIYNWVDLEKNTAGLFKNSAPWIDPKRMQAHNMIKVKTRDGRQLDAYLTLPAGATKQNPSPMVVLSHGGPWYRDSWSFDGEAQFLASRGYAVLQTNYRGSTSYDWMFPAADRWDFRKMHDDVTDATKTAIASGLIDSKRIAIMGGSFGGYLAVSGVVNEPTLYRCAVTIAGVFDWEQQVRDQKHDQYDDPSFGLLVRGLGDPKKQPERFDAISPGRHVDKIRVPVFVAGGKEDRTVDIAQSRALISALEKYDVTHETLVVSREGHGMGHLDNEVELYTRIVAFLDKYVKLAQPVVVTP